MGYTLERKKKLTFFLLYWIVIKTKLKNMCLKLLEYNYFGESAKLERERLKYFQNHTLIGSIVEKYF